MPKPKDPWNFIKKKSLILKEAIKRNPQYRQEFEAAFHSFQASQSNTSVGNPYYSAGNPYYDQQAFNLTDEAKKLCQRWGLVFALHPDNNMLDMQGFELAVFGHHCMAVKMLLNGEAKVISIPLKMIPYKKGKPFPIPPGETALKKLVLKAKRCLNIIYKGVDRRPWLRDGRYLRVDIDLSQSQAQIVAEIDNMVENYRHLVSWTAKPPRSLKKFIAPPIPSDLPSDEWFKQRQAQIDEERKFREAQLKPRRNPSLDIDLFPVPSSGPVTIFQVWDMKNKQGKSSWKIAQELYLIKNMTPQKCTNTKCEEREYFKKLNGKNKEDYSGAVCGKKDLCYEAKGRLKNVKDAIRRANVFILSSNPDKPKGDTFLVPPI